MALPRANVEGNSESNKVKNLASLPSYCICLLCCMNLWIKKLLPCLAALHIVLLIFKKNFAHDLRLMQFYQKFTSPEEIKEVCTGYELKMVV